MVQHHIAILQNDGLCSIQEDFSLNIQDGGKYGHQIVKKVMDLVMIMTCLITGHADISV